MASPRSNLPVKAAVVYVLVATIWVLVSDQILGWFASDRDSLMFLASIRSGVFVLVTGVLLYLLMTRVVGQLKRSEEALRAQELRWKQALETVGDGVWEADPATGKAYFSRSWKAMLGYADDEIGDELNEWISRIHPDDRAMVEDGLRKCLEGGGLASRREYRIKAKDGTYLWSLTRGGLAPHGYGDKPIRLIGTCVDISQRKSAEGKMADALSFAKAVLQSSPTGVIAFEANGSAVIANESAARMLGADVPGLLQENFRNSEAWRNSGLLAAADEALRMDRRVEYVGSLVSRGGSTLQIQAQLVPFMYVKERHLLLLLSDVTRAHYVSENLNMMQVAAQAAPVGWVVTDARGHIEWVNPAFTKLTGYTSAEVVGLTPRILKSGQQPADYYAAMWKTIRGGKIWSGELINRRKDGSHYHEFNTIAPVCDQDGAISHYVAIKQDISERKKLEVQLSRSQRLESIGQLACGIVHDLNNMLSPIMLSLGMIRMKHNDPETLSYVQMMESAAQRGAGVLRQVLTFAQGVEGERIELEPKILIKEVVNLAQETFPRQIKVAYEIKPEVSQVKGDLTQVHQVLLNLAVNARDAMPAGGVLTFSAGDVLVDAAQAERQLLVVKPGRYVCFAARDTGTGIPAEVIEHMFEPFYTTKPRGKGTGLGLSTVFGIVRTYGGFIEVDSELGRGTEIRIYLPAVVRAEEVARTVGETAAKLIGGGRKVLVVEDEPLIREVTCRLLSRHGFVAVGAHDGLDGLTQFLADPAGFSAVILDLMMPNMTGYELARELRQHTSDLPILASSGLTSDNPSEKGAETLRAMGVYTLLLKPYSEEQLVDALAQELVSRDGNGL